MFSKSPEERLSIWKNLRESVETSDDPLLDVIEFWKESPFIPYNKDVDPYNKKSWPTPWDIIVTNKYDDFTRAIMLAYSLKYTERFSKSDIQVQSIVDNDRNLAYNVVCVDNKWILNYDDNQPVEVANVPVSFRIENLAVIERPR